MSNEDKSLDDLDKEQKKQVEELLEKEARSERKPTGLWHWASSLLSAALVLIYFYGSGYRALPTEYHLGVYVLVTYVLVFLLYSAGSRSACLNASIGAAFLVSLLGACFLVFDSPSALWDQLTYFRETWLYDGFTLAWKQDLGSLWLIPLIAVPIAAVLIPTDRALARRFPQAPTASDLILALAAIITVVYWISQFEALNYRAGAENQLDRLVGVVGVVLSLEVCRRVLGWSITLVGVGALCFGLFGPYLPELFAHRGFSFDRLAISLFITTNGVFGVMAGVLATYVILFIFFGAFLQKSGAGKFFVDLPLAIAGRSTGGPAKVAVMSSALFGSVAGSAIANTVASGSFTIPMMKKAGFKPHVAGAIEPASSIGGAFLPPVMGAGGFVMAELTGLPYTHIMLLAIGPALLYFLAVFCMVHFDATKNGLLGLADVPDWRQVLRHGWFYSLPLVVITVLMMMGRSPGNAAFWATLSCIAVSWMHKDTRMGPKEIWEAIQVGARNTLVIGSTVGVIGIIVGVISLTGMGLKFSDLIIQLAGNSLLLAIVLIAIASLVLGMGVPVTASYLIIAVLAVPALGEYGIAAITGHMIVYWLSQDSNITPPVCVAAYAGAAIAKSDPWKTGWTSFKFAKMLYVTPLLFAYVPGILLEGSTFDIFSAFFSATLGTIAFSALAMGCLRRTTRLHEWLLLGAATFLLYWPTFLTDAIGVALAALVWWLQRDAHTARPQPS